MKGTRSSVSGGARRIAWPEAAARVGVALPVGRWEAAARAWMEHAAAQKRGAAGRWVVAVSGGADSVALVLGLWAHFPALRRRWVVAHFNHRLRGRAAAGDARFCAGLAAGLGVPAVMGEWVGESASGVVNEATARAARWTFFRATVRRRRCGAVWLGHQADDVAETMLMRLARGSGTAGLAAPRPVQAGEGGLVHVRPLLGCTKAEIEAVLAAAGVPWREDATNAGGDFLRNRMRHHVVPAWRAAAGEGGRNVLQGVGLARARLEEDDAALEAWVDELAVLDAAGRLDLERLAGKPIAVWRRALHRWLGWHGPATDLARAGFEQLLAGVQAAPRGRFSLGARAFAVWRKGILTLETRVARKGGAH